MRFAAVLRSILVALALTAGAGASTGCSSPEITAENIQEKGGVIEQHDAATVVWSVSPEGKVWALVKTPDGKPAQGVAGTVAVRKTAAGATPTTMPVQQEKEAGMISATVPALEDDLTELKYDLKVDGKTAAGVLHLPRGGTQELVESAKAAAEAKIAKDQKGPNGGVLQVVGEDIVEVVADKTGSVRVYILDEDLKPVQVGERKVKLALWSPKGPDIVIVEPDKSGLFLLGKMGVVVNPVKITVSLTHKDKTHVVVCGYHPGSIIVVGASAPVIVIVANVTFDADVVVVNPSPVIVVDHHYKGKGKGKGKFKVRGKGGKVQIHIH